MKIEYNNMGCCLKVSYTQAGAYSIMRCSTKTLSVHQKVGVYAYCKVRFATYWLEEAPLLVWIRAHCERLPRFAHNDVFLDDI